MKALDDCFKLEEKAIGSFQKIKSVLSTLQEINLPSVLDKEK